MVYDEIRIWVDIAEFLVLGGIGVWLYLDRHDELTEERINQLERHVDKRLDAHGTRLAHVEAELQHMPNHSDMGAVHEKINEVAKEQRATAAVLSGIARQVADIDRFLRSRDA